MQIDSNVLSLQQLLDYTNGGQTGGSPSAWGGGSTGGVGGSDDAASCAPGGGGRATGGRDAWGRKVSGGAASGHKASAARCKSLWPAKPDKVLAPSFSPRTNASASARKPATIAGSVLRVSKGLEKIAAVAMAASSLVVMLNAARLNLRG